VARAQLGGSVGGVPVAVGSGSEAVVAGVAPGAADRLGVGPVVAVASQPTSRTATAKVKGASHPGRRLIAPRIAASDRPGAPGVMAKGKAARSTVCGMASSVDDQEVDAPAILPRRDRAAYAPRSTGTTSK
jgi:hypothetical protein